MRVSGLWEGLQIPHSGPEPGVAISNFFNLLFLNLKRMAPAEPRRFTPSHLRAEIRAKSCINIHSHRSAAPRYDCSLSIGKVYDSPKCFHYEPFKQKYYRNFTSSVHLDSGNTDIFVPLLPFANPPELLWLVGCSSEQFSLCCNAGSSGLPICRFSQ